MVIHGVWKCWMRGRRREEERRRKELERGEEKKSGWEKEIRAYAHMARARRWLISRVARTRHVRVCASGVCARGTTLARRRHNSLENVWRLELLNPRVRTHGARAWMVENA